jgi:TRAP-type C4-dicarboxylate transport system permease small subunit
MKQEGDKQVKQDTLMPAAPIGGADPATRPPPVITLPRIEKGVGVVFCAIVLLNFCSAVGRYAGTTLFIGADEVQVYAMIWLIFLGAAIAGRRGMHLRMDLLVHRLGPTGAAWRQCAESCIALLVCGTMAWISFNFVRDIAAMGQRSDAAGIPMWMVHAAPAAGFAGLAVAAALELARTWRSRPWA